jgi:hypothetical protein
MNRMQALVLGQLALYGVAVVAILVAAPGVYTSQLPRSLTHGGAARLAELGALLALTVLLAVLAAGVIRGWRWTFWVILIAFTFGILHALVSALQLAGIAPIQGPAWYVAFQGIVGLIQFVSALALLAGFRRAGIWSTP